MAKEEIAMKILSLAKSISSNSASEVMALHHWHDLPKRERWEKIIISGAVPSYLKWTEEDEAVLRMQEAEPISTKEMDLGQMKEQHKKEIFAIFRMLPKDREVIIKDMTVEENGGTMVEGKGEESKGQNEEEEVI